MSFRPWLLLAAVLAAFVATPVKAQDVLVFAAASLKNALDEVAADYRSRTGAKATLSYASSSALAKQIENGAPAGLFIAADLDWMTYLAERNLIQTATRTNLLGNRLVLIAPRDSAVDLVIGKDFALAALLGTGRLAMGDPAHVPAGKYARSALEALGVWTAVAPRLARADNVRAALALVARGEAPLGIVYATDARSEPGVRVVGAFPADTHPPVIYPAAVVVGAKGAGAKAFLDHLTTPGATAVFQKHGFTPAP